MVVRYLFFGATADVTGQRVLDLELPPNSTVAAAVDLMTEKFPALKTHKLLCALNQNYVASNESLKDGDEIAIFTAVSGG